MKFVKFPTNKTKKRLKNFLLKISLIDLIKSSKQAKLSINQMLVNKPYKPELFDLYRLYQFIILNKRTTILEFGTGWSSLIFSIALNELKKKYKKKVEMLRRNNPFELFIVDNEKKFLNISKKRVENSLI